MGHHRLKPGTRLGADGTRNSLDILCLGDRSPLWLTWDTKAPAPTWSGVEFIERMEAPGEGRVSDSSP